MPVKEVPDTDVIEVGNQFYIRAQSSLADTRTLVLLHNDTFAVFDRYGDIQTVGSLQQGVFYQETRHLSRLELRISGLRPLLLSSTVRDDNVLIAVDLTNPDMQLASGESLARGTLHIYRTKLLADGGCFDKIGVHNFGQKPVDVELCFAFSADFADIFEVRGQKRERRGTLLQPEVGRSSVTLAYEGLDHVLRRTRLECSPLPCSVRTGEISVPIHLEPHDDTFFWFNIVCERNGSSPTAAGL